MPEGWRHRYMAPVYALLVSFVLVLIVGNVLPKPQAQTPRPGSTTTTQPATTKPTQGTVPAIRFDVTSSKVPTAPKVRVADLRGYKVELRGEDNEVLKEFKLGADGLLPVPTTRFLVCMELPEGWTSAEGKTDPGSPKTCWGPKEPGNDVTVRLIGPEG